MTCRERAEALLTSLFAIGLAHDAYSDEKRARQRCAALAAIEDALDAEHLVHAMSLRRGEES